MILRYIAMQIGCLECGEGSVVLGVFRDRADAQRVCTELEDEWDSSSRDFRVFEIGVDAEEVDA
jgi:hypothetical protein